MGNKYKHKIYTEAHQAASRQGLKEIARYDAKFRPLVTQARDEALNWDSEQRQQFNLDRATSGARFGLRKISQAAGADVSDIIRGGAVSGQVMSEESAQGHQVTGWQKLKKLAGVASHARHQQNVVDGNMRNLGNMQAQQASQQAAIDQYLDNMRGQMAGQAIGVAGAVAAKGVQNWWNSRPHTGVDAASGGVYAIPNTNQDTTYVVGR